MISNTRRELFSDLYRLAESYEKPPFKPGDIEGNANWFAMSYESTLKGFLAKYPNDELAYDLASAIIEDANRQAVAANKQI